MRIRIISGVLAGAAGLLILPGMASAQSQAYTTSPVNLYAGPAQDYPVVSQLPAGVPVAVMGCVSGYTWCDVAIQDQRGWVYAGYLNYPYQGNNVQLLNYGTAIGLPIVTFSIGTYWGSYYRGRPCITTRRIGNIMRHRRLVLRLGTAARLRDMAVLLQDMVAHLRGMAVLRRNTVVHLRGMAVLRRNMVVRLQDMAVPRREMVVRLRDTAVHLQDMANHPSSTVDLRRDMVAGLRLPTTPLVVVEAATTRLAAGTRSITTNRTHASSHRSCDVTERQICALCRV